MFNILLFREMFCKIFKKTFELFHKMFCKMDAKQTNFSRNFAGFARLLFCKTAAYRFIRNPISNPGLLHDCQVR
jgi:hypothetical protein